MTPEQELIEDERVLFKMTPGPWYAFGPWTKNDAESWVIPVILPIEYPSDDRNNVIDLDTARQEDIEGIAYIRNRFPALVARVRELEAALPLTADGVRIVRGMKLWRMSDFGPASDEVAGYVESENGWHVLWRGGWQRSQANWSYSTESAARAASSAAGADPLPKASA